MAAASNGMEITIEQKRKKRTREPMLDQPSVTFPLSYLIFFLEERKKNGEDK